MIPVIICATMSQNIETCATILQNGFDPNATASGEDIKNLLKDKAHELMVGDGFTSLICATILENIDMVNVLIKHCSDINSKTEYGFTALIYSAYINNYDICEILIQNSAETKAVTECGYTALNYAALNGNAKMCQMILSAQNTHSPIDKNIIENNLVSHKYKKPLSCRDYVLRILLENKKNPLSTKDIHSLFPEEVSDKYSVQNISTVIFSLSRESKVHNSGSYKWHII